MSTSLDRRRDPFPATTRGRAVQRVARHLEVDIARIEASHLVQDIDDDLAARRASRRIRNLSELEVDALIGLREVERAGSLVSDPMNQARVDYLSEIGLLVAGRIIADYAERGRS